MLAGCAGVPGRDDSIVEAIKEAAINAPDGAILDLATVVEGDWDRLVVLLPDSVNDDAYDALGFRWPVEDTGSGFFDHAYRVILVDDGEVMSWANLSEDDLGVCDWVRSLTRPQAKVLVAVSVSGRRYLTQVADPPPPGTVDAEICHPR